MKYVKKAHHKKKVWTDEEITRKTWREYKKVRNDKGSHHYRGKPCQFNPGRWVKKQTSSYRRSYVKELLSKEDFDLICDWNPNFFYSRYIWS